MAVLAAGLMAGCDGLDMEQADVCQALLPALETALDDPGRHAIDPHVTADPDHPRTVVLHYRLSGEPATADHWIRCTFAGSGFDSDRRVLTAVETDRRGRLSDLRLHMVQRFWLGSFLAQSAVRGAGDTARGPPAWAYALQQLLNALPVGALYGLLAMAFTLVFAVIGRINMAFGEVAMVGAYAALTLVHLLTARAGLGQGGLGLAVTVAAAAAYAAGAAALLGWTTQRLVFRPLAGRAGQAALIATVGLALVLQEGIRLSQGADDHWLQPVLNRVLVVARAEGFTVTITPFKLALLATVAGLYVLLLRFVVRGPFGRAWRAVADDRRMAALVGLDVDRTVGRAFALGAGLAGLAGVVLTLHYGGVSFHMGTLLGFKALTAAVLGGFGSLPGAMVGGLLIGLLETLWSAYFHIAYRDLAVFAVLALVLVFRPRGLLGGLLGGVLGGQGGGRAEM
ncbi:MAG: branched-chain amino acid ABC transporter permease [Rhodobacterales bacterium]|nr:branched-chain amino acid ABC transporter permease [Rhodobacterales bacterium]